MSNGYRRIGIHVVHTHMHKVFIIIVTQVCLWAYSWQFASSFLCFCILYTIPSVKKARKHIRFMDILSLLLFVKGVLYLTRFLGLFSNQSCHFDARYLYISPFKYLCCSLGHACEISIKSLKKNNIRWSHIVILMQPTCH